MTSNPFSEQLAILEPSSDSCPDKLGGCRFSASPKALECRAALHLFQIPLAGNTSVVTSDTRTSWARSAARQTQRPIADRQSPIAYGRIVSSEARRSSSANCDTHICSRKRMQTMQLVGAVRLRERP